MQSVVGQQALTLDDMAVPFARMDEREVVEIARDRFGVAARATRFATEKDDTFLITAETGDKFVLKIGNPADPVDDSIFQNALLQHIAAVDPTLPVPNVIADRDGNALGQLTDSAGQVRILRMLSYLEGTPLDAIATTSVQRERIGETLARLRLATAPFSHPGAHRTLLWDVKHFPRLENLLAGVDDADQRRLLSDAFRRVLDSVPRIDALRTQVLHNDFSRSNIVVDPAAPAFVTGVIDFGDAVHTAIAIDVSTALLNQLPKSCVLSDDILADGRDLVRGYLRIADLTDDELQIIPFLVLARVIARGLISLQLAKRFPANATYLLRNTEQGWAQLRWFAHRSVSDFSNMLTAQNGAAGCGK